MPAPVAPVRRQDTADILDRLVKLEGHLHGIHRMVEQERPCIDILHQITAARAALSQVAVRLVADHVRQFVAAARAGGGNDEEQLRAEVGELLRQLP